MPFKHFIAKSYFKLGYMQYMSNRQLVLPLTGHSHYGKLGTQVNVGLH